MEEKHGNVEKMFKQIKDNDQMPKVNFYLNWQCANCGAEYGTQPNYCHGCRCNNLVQIKPKEQILL